MEAPSIFRIPRLLFLQSSPSPFEGKDSSSPPTPMIKSCRLIVPVLKRSNTLSVGSPTVIGPWLQAYRGGAYPHSPIDGKWWAHIGWILMGSRCTMTPRPSRARFLILQKTSSFWMFKKEVLGATALSSE